MLQINGKTFMNLQEAVQWLLDNNALPFQSSANYVANTEIGMGTIVNPSPAKVRIGSLIFFADSKVSTVTGLTENGFIVSDQYNDLVDDIVYVSNVAINASNHLIVTLSNGDDIDAGLIKEVSSFSIDASQHLIANYNDGTTQDLGAIFNGNVTITGDFKAKTVEQTNANYSVAVDFASSTALTFENIYNRFEVINNVLWLIINTKVTCNVTQTYYLINSRYVTLPASVASKIYDLAGVSCDNGNVGNPTFIAGQKMVIVNNIQPATPVLVDNIEIDFAIAHHASNSLYLAITTPGVAMTAGDVLWLTARLPLTMI